MRGKKLRGNGLFESSRMIIPQHREAIRKHQERLKIRERPELDEQRIEELSAALAEAVDSGAQTAVTTFGEYGDKTALGVVLNIDQIDRTVRLRTRAETVRIRLADIVNVGRL